MVEQKTRVANIGQGEAAGEWGWLDRTMSKGKIRERKKGWAVVRARVIELRSRRVEVRWPWVEGVEQTRNQEGR